MRLRVRETAVPAPAKTKIFETANPVCIAMVYYGDGEPETPKAERQEEGGGKAGNTQVLSDYRRTVRYGRYSSLQNVNASFNFKAQLQPSIATSSFVLELLVLFESHINFEKKNFKYIFEVIMHLIYVNHHGDQTSLKCSNETLQFLSGPITRYELKRLTKL